VYFYRRATPIDARRAATHRATTTRVDVVAIGRDRANDDSMGQGRRATARARAKARAIHRESRRDDSIRACECFSFSSKSRAFIAIVSRVFTPRRSS
jgi:hypothetical protein